MNGEYAFAVITIATMLYSVWMIRNQQKTIDKLNDRLMARSFTEYKSAQVIKEDDVSPEREDDDPKGWFDH
jgi:hypothetical protein